MHAHLGSGVGLNPVKVDPPVELGLLGGFEFGRELNAAAVV